MPNQNQENNVYAESQSIIIKTTDDILELGNLIPEAMGLKQINLMELLYILGAQLNNDQPNEQLKDLLQKIGKGLRDLPMFYHSQLFRSVINEFYGTVYDTMETADKTAETISMRDSLLADTRHFIEVTKHIPSPFEIIYLYIEAIIDQNRQSTEEIATAQNILSYVNLQKRVLLDYIDSYDNAYKDQLKQGVMESAD